MSSSFPSDMRARGPQYLIQAWGLPAMVLVLLVSLWVLVFVVSSGQRERLIEDSQRELGQLNSAVSGHVSGLFVMVDTQLRVLDRWLQDNPAGDPRTDRHFAMLVEEIRQASGGLIDPRLVSLSGQLFNIPHPAGTATLDVSDRGYFITQRQMGEARLVIGEPMVSRLTGRLGLPVSLRLTRPVAGLFLVAANLDLERLTTLHEEMRLKPHGTIVVMRADGTVLSRAPYDQNFVGRSLADSPLYATEFGVRQRGSFISAGSRSDGVERLVNYQRLAGYPVSVLVTRTMADVLETYTMRRDLAFGAAAILTLLAAGFTLVLLRSQRALHEARRHLEWLEATDSLTGVMSRRAFLEAAQREFNRARRYGRPTAVLLIDLDHFKQVNDTYGHATGDSVLSECASAWQTVLREQDLLGRIGGEEFCAVLPEASPGAALQAAERLRKSVLSLRFHAQREEFSVSVSVGLAMVEREDETFSQSLERADQALYLAKERGRNRVESLGQGELMLIDRGADAA